jgi:uncharacterized protein (DUF1800 family)
MEMSRAGHLAVSRFGMGPGPGEVAAAARDPRGWALAQVGARPAASRRFDDLPSGKVAARSFTRFVRGARGDADARLPESARSLYMREAVARIAVQVEGAAPFVERLVAFWSNHFTVSIQRAVVLPLAGAFEREAIRPHVLGRFGDMLLAVARHPAMLLYLDQAQSAGPASMAARRRGRGINENLAREILELHTLGVEGGYSQDDVAAFARILTGWSIAREDEPDPGSFLFRERAHEPGEKLLLGRRFAEAGEDEAVAALGMLARHPSTAHNVATRMARHFVADDPPPALVAALSRAFLEGDGDLAALAATLLRHDASWSAPATKLKTPNDFVVSALRAADIVPEDQRIVGALRILGQMPFAAPSPAGWPDRAEHWIGPEAIMRRATWAMALGARVAEGQRPEAFLARALGDAASEATRLWMPRAASASDAIALVLASPEFQRR